jgi:hypothetical protein
MMGRFLMSAHAAKLAAEEHARLRRERERHEEVTARLEAIEKALRHLLGALIEENQGSPSASRETRTLDGEGGGGGERDETKEL